MSGAIFHLEWPRMKHEENSNRGDREAVRTGHTASDHDWTKSNTGTVWNNHWPDPWRRDGFIDPEHEFGKGDRLRDLTDAEVRRQVAHTDGHEFHIRTADEGIANAAKVGLERVFGEAKPGYWTVADFRARKRTARQHGIGLTVMTMDNWKGWRGVLYRARLAGCRTRRIRMN